MMRLLFTWTVLLALAMSMQVEAAPARRRSVAPTAFSIGPGDRILWIAAHPDDETVIAPLLGTLCIEGGVTCSFLVLTRGENGVCKLPGGCAPGLGTVRAAEMRRSAGMFGATLTQWELSDVMSGPAASWAAESRGEAALVARIREVITQERPAAVLTFDAMHGTTCHPAHQAVSELASKAIQEIAFERPRLFFLETAVSFSDGRIHFSNALAGSPAIIFDARSTWHYLVTVAGIHASQFSDSELESLRMTADEEKKVLLSASPWPRAYATTCP